MRTAGLFAMCILLAACTATPLFPPAIMKDVETESFSFKAWKEQAHHATHADFVPHKLQLGGQIIKVIRKSEGVVILAEEQSIEKSSGGGSGNLEPEGSFMFAIFFNGFPESDMLQAGNRLVVVGTTDRTSAEVIGWTPRVLPHLLAQCLHIWNTQGLKTIDDFPYLNAMGHYPSEERTFCIEGHKRRSLSISDALQAREAEGKEAVQN